jgi:protein-S-isoprenylcysteine O-methyltransferase Ste14
MDLLIAGLAFLLYPATAVVAGLDVRCTGRRRYPPSCASRRWRCSCWLRRVVLGGWANPFFSAVVRIQRERGHRVVSRGPYAFVRHPGYAGPLLAHVCLPLALGSLWGLLPALAGCACLVLRIGFEEGVLRAELAGYAEYAQRVRWRLLPYVW